jgi:hypothetical protein
MALEPRMVFDGAAAATAHAVHSGNIGHFDHHIDAPSFTSHSRSNSSIDPQPPMATLWHPPTATTPATPTAPTGPAVIFIDSRVQDPGSLLQGVTPGTEVVTLQANQDGLKQMAGYLAQHPEVGSVEIIAHGNDGELLLGDTLLTSANLTSHAQTLGSIGANLRPGADILIYACDTAADAQGVAFVDTLAHLIGHTVAASSRAIGAAGGWDLTVTTGDINAVPALSSAAESAYQDNLGLLAVTSSGDNVATAGTLRYEIAHSASGDVIYFNGVSTVTLSSGNPLSISNNLTIESDLAGDGSNPVTIDANHTSGVMSITGGNVSLIGLVLENGLIAGNGGGYGAGADQATSGGKAIGAGLYVGGSSTVVTMNHVTFAADDATGGGGGGSGYGYSFGGGGGSGISGIGGGKGGRFNASGAGSSGPGGNGGLGGFMGGVSSYSGSGGVGGNTAGSVTGHGGQGGAGGAPGEVNGGAGATAGVGTSAIGGGGGGSGLGGIVGGAGGNAAGGL